MNAKYFMIFLGLFFCVFVCNDAMAQKCIKFRYDASGNRVWRHVANNCYEVREVSEVSEIAESEIKIFPNPANEQIQIILPSDLNLDYSFYELFNLNGVKIKEGRVESHETVINIKDEDSGVYLLKVYYGEEMQSKIILKQ